MEVPSNWICPICGRTQDDAAYVTPCLHQLCYGCAVWWANKKPSCAICGQNIRTIRFSVRSEDDYLECPVPQPTQHSDDGLQDEQRPAEPAFVAPEHNFPPEVWAAFFREHPEDHRALLRWLHREFRRTSGNKWWVVHTKQSIVMVFLCRLGLDEEPLLQELRQCLRGQTLSFVRRLITIAAAMYGPKIRQLQGLQNNPVDSPSPTTSHEGPSASSPDRSASPAGPSTKELPSIPRGHPRHPTTDIVSAEEEPGQTATTGPSAQCRDGSPGKLQHPSKRKASSSPQDSAPPSKRRPRRQH